MRVFSPRRSRPELLAHLRERLQRLTASLPVRRVVLFGSWANGRATAFSDVDLLVVYAGPKQDDAYARVWRAFDLPNLEAHVYAEEEAERVQATLERMTRDGVVLLDAGAAAAAG